jgi:histidine kinase
MSLELSGFLLLEQLHASHRSVVHRARRRSDGQPVILKLNGPEVTPEQAAARYEHERGLLQRVRSWLVIQAHEVVREGAVVALVLEDFGGEALAATLLRGPLALREGLQIALDVSRAVREVHAAGIFHRDVNPHNVVYNRQTRLLKLIDFDVACGTKADAALGSLDGAVAGALPGPLAGTLAYMAPEQTGRMNRSADQRADLYALGVTLYRLFTGRLPYDSDDPVSLVHSHLAITPTPPDRVAAVPPALSQLVMKLLAKAPEDRYQTAAGLCADLTRMVEQERAGPITPFPLGSQDHSGRFEVSSRLYGRDEERKQLRAAFERAAAGDVEVVLLSGPSGAGKSSLVLDLFGALGERRGHFLRGKFDQLRRDVPHSALVAAFEELAADLLLQPEADAAQRREAILRATAPNTRVVVEVMPALERLLGPQPPLPLLDATGTQNRFNHTLQKFIQLFARKGRPLVLFLDDLQWADVASLTLLKGVVSSAETEALLLVAALRDGDPEVARPLREGIEVRQRGTRRALALELAPLGRAHTAELLADTLHRDRASLHGLAEVVWRKTKGNPFFIRQFLHALHEQGRIVFDESARRFEFELGAVAAAPSTENVADLLATAVRKLPPETRRLLAMAAAMGNRFELAALAAVTGRPVSVVHQGLAPAVLDELIRPSAEHEPLQVSRGSVTGDVGLTRFAFSHDRIQQAAYAAVPVPEQAALHLTIGRALARRGAGDPDERIFDVVSHLNRASALITDPEERALLASLNLKAGARARRSGAHALAAGNYRCAVALCGWADDHSTSFEAHLRLAESLHLSADHAGALAVADDTARHARSNLERAELDALRSGIYLNMGDLRQTLACCRQAAATLGLELPEPPEQVQAQLARGMGRILERLGASSMDRLLELPAMRHPGNELLLRLLQKALPAAYMTDPTLFALFCASMVNLSLEHGNASPSAAGYAGLSVVLNASGHEAEGQRLGKLAVAIAERQDNAAVKAAAVFQYAVFSLPWGDPLGESMPLLRRALQLGLQGGDYAMAGYSAGFIAIHGLLLGAPLPELLEETERNRKLTSELGEVITSRMLALLRQVVRSYRGGLADRSRLDGDGVSEQALLQAAVEAANPTDQFWLHLHCCEHRYAAGEHEAARVHAEACEALLHAVPGSVAAPQQRFYHALALTALWRRADDGRRAAWAGTLETAQQQLRRWAERGSGNFAPLSLLVEAERARVGAAAGDPLELYEQAITAAGERGWLKIEALANELCGGHWLERGKRHLALVYLARARDHYASWGALRKVQDLEEAHPELTAGPRGQAASTSSSNLGVAGSLDLTSVVRGAQAISGEIVLERLLAVMMEIILKNAGAQGGALLLEDRGTLRLEACKSPEAKEISLLQAIPLAEATSVSRAIVETVARTGQSLVLDDASRHPQFGADPDVRARRPASVLCMPIVHKTRLAGVLYLENNLVRGAFTWDRLEALKILTSQLAVSLENATLFAQLTTYRDRLEELVAARTSELEESREQYRRIVESTNAVPFSYAPAEGRFSYVGPQAEKLFGYPADRWKDADLLELLVPADEVARTRARLNGATPGDELEFEGPACTADRRTLQLRWVISCHELRGQPNLRGLILDITERWRLESELAQAQKLESVGRLAAGVAHEINTPVQFVSDSVTFVRDAMADVFAVLAEYQQLPALIDDPAALAAATGRARQAEQDHDLAYVVESAPPALDRALEGLGRVASIVRAMKQFAHPDRNEKAPVDLNGALQSTLTIARNEYKYVADLETDFAPLPLVLCHAGEINQAVLNIVVNAAHAIADVVHGTEQKGKITVRTRSAGEQVEIAIGDTGTGIPEAIRARIFDPFFTTKEVGRGTGQGLAIARNVVNDKHGGTLTFETTPGQGTTFFIRLPIGIPAAELASAPAES